MWQFSFLEFWIPIVYLSVCVRVKFHQKGMDMSSVCINLHLFYFLFTQATRTQLGDIIPSPCFVFFSGFFFEKNKSRSKNTNRINYQAISFFFFLLAKNLTFLFFIYRRLKNKVHSYFDRRCHKDLCKSPQTDFVHAISIFYFCFALKYQNNVVLFFYFVIQK